MGLIIHPFHGNSLLSKSFSSKVTKRDKKRAPVIHQNRGMKHGGLFPLIEKILFEKSEGTFVETEIPKA